MSTQTKRKRSKSNANQNYSMQIHCKSTSMATKHQLAINDTIINVANHTATKSRRSKKKKSRRNSNTLSIPKHTKNKQRRNPAKKARNEFQLLKLKDNKTLRIVGLPKLSAKIIKLYKRFGVIENIVHGKTRRKRGQRWVQIEYKTSKSAHQAIRWTNNVLFQFGEKFVQCKSMIGWRQKYKYAESQKNDILSAQEQQHFDDATSGVIRGLVYDAEMERELSISKLIKQNKELQHKINELVQQSKKNDIERMDQNITSNHDTFEHGHERKIVSFIDKQIRMNTGNILFASGCNGSGLHATVKHIFDWCVANKKDYNLDNIVQINANCLDKCDAASAYSLIYHKIMSKTPRSRSPCKNRLKKVVCGKSLENQKLYIVIIDNVDLLIHKRNQKVLTNLISWSKRQNSKLILFGTSNAIPIMTRFVKNRKNNELLLTFKP